MYHRGLPGEGAFEVPEVLAELAQLGVRTRIGPELYQRTWSERPAKVVAVDLMAATRAVLGRRPGPAAPGEPSGERIPGGVRRS